ncbi:MAG: UDP-N-acetylglucosamine 2-epimerase (non-hydrolyzing) [Candidatus Micrarchaeia archaeon]|jgi:UDP-N-acetylglucosamine 2-epimerase (non-hydrolysing)
MKKICLIAGTRPNFMKIAPLINEVKKHRDIKYILIHTGQHSDIEMSDYFFKDLDIPKPTINLNISNGNQTNKIWKFFGFLKEFPRLILFYIKTKPDVVVVVGDVTSTLYCALVAKLVGIKVAHVEAGLRSNNKKMPEEFNRVYTDKISDFLFVTEEDALVNLKKEGIQQNKIFFVGNIMIDSLVLKLSEAKKSKILENLNLNKKEYCVLTLHRVENIENKEVLKNLLESIKEVQNHIKIVWSLHPRTKFQLEKFGFIRYTELPGIILTKSLGYLDFLCLVYNSKFVLTDSGGIQEETTYLSIPCLTMRTETERPITIKIGTNTMVYLDKNKIIEESIKIINGNIKKGTIPRYWEGKTSRRIINVLKSI